MLITSLEVTMPITQQLTRGAHFNNINSNNDAYEHKD